jgi:hypothetical protein
VNIAAMAIALTPGIARVTVSLRATQRHRGRTTSTAIVAANVDTRRNGKTRGAPASIVRPSIARANIVQASIATASVVRMSAVTAARPGANPMHRSS